MEIALKARICKTLKWTTGFPQTNAEFQEKGSLLKTHNLQLLLEYTAIQGQIPTEFLREWAVVRLWSTEQRYNPPGTKTRIDADDMIAATQTLLRKLL